MILDIILISYILILKMFSSSNPREYEKIIVKYINSLKNEIILRKGKKQTECVEPSGYKTAKNGRLMFWCTCASCEIKKTRFVKSKN